MATSATAKPGKTTTTSSTTTATATATATAKPDGAVASTHAQTVAARYEHLHEHAHSDAFAKSSLEYLTRADQERGGQANGDGEHGEHGEHGHSHGGAFAIPYNARTVSTYLMEFGCAMHSVIIGSFSFRVVCWFSSVVRGLLLFL